MTLAALTTFFGWMTVLNVGLLLLTSLILLAFQKPILGIHGTITGLNEATLKKGYFDFLAYYKIATIVFAITPYLALKLM